MVLAALAAVVLLSGCTGKQDPGPQPSAQAVVQEEVVPLGYYRKPKDGQVCKKLDPAPLQALIPGIAPGPAIGVFQSRLKCEFSVNTPSLVSIVVAAEMFESADGTAKFRELLVNTTQGIGTAVTLPLSRAEAFVDGIGVNVFEQNMALSGGGYVTDKAMVTPRLAEVVQRMVDEMLLILRKEYQSTTGPSPTAQAKERRVVSPLLVRGREVALEQTYFEVQFILREDLDDLDPSPTVAQTYGSTKANNVLIFAATLAVLKAEAQIDSTLTRLAREGITMAKPVSDKLDEWTEIRCGDGKIKQFTGALCLWRDKDSIGVVAFPGQTPADVKADLLALRDLVTKG